MFYKILGIIKFTTGQKRSEVRPKNYIFLSEVRLLTSKMSSSVIIKPSPSHTIHTIFIEKTTV